MSAHPLVYLPFPLESLAQTRDRRPLRKRERQSGYSYMTFSAFSQFTNSVLLHIRLAPRRGRHDSAAQFFCALCRKAPAKINCTECLIRRCRALQHAKVLRDTVMSRLRRVTRMCSSTLSDPANRLQNKRCGNPTAVPLFSKRSPVSGLRQTI